ncbi:MAG TPA: alginate export family protein [Candidatus Hydrogenedentes bacterium]|nr:alginate export family protein [Candidatus Hydrogenedentota bacterium]HPG70192.1 alginate export family protein [Candidatus Hydrogenedentota bacterium]
MNRTWLVVFLFLAWAGVIAVSPSAEMANIEVGGEITIEGDWWTNTNERGSDVRWAARHLFKRPVGWGSDITSWLALDEGNDWSAVTQYTKLHVKADFTDDVTAFIEFDSLDVWGEDFRSNYVTGVDASARSVDDVEIYQAYVESAALFGTPLALRIGRQELVFGSAWLLGSNVEAPIPWAWGLSYDGLRLTYAGDAYSVDAWGMKLEENSPLEQDGDIDFYGLYGSYTGYEALGLDAYALWVRDGRRVSDTALSLQSEWLEDRFGLDDYDVTNLYTVGVRAFGESGGFDYEAEVAYQWGDAGQVGAIFAPAGFPYGDDDADFDAWACNLQVGYSFETRWNPRPHAGLAFFEGEDNRDLSFVEWLNPFYVPRASVSFNRLFSDWCYSMFLDASELSNLAVVYAGVEAAPTDKLTLGLVLSYFEADEPFDAPAHVRLGPHRILLATTRPFWTETNDDELGWELGLDATYAYSEDLEFGAGWYHFFPEDGAEEGSFISSNGLDFVGGTDDDQADYLYGYVTLFF